MRLTRHAFTLIELLVVISIVALLVAILLPALKKARVAAQMSQSMSNIRQLSISLHTYAADNSDSMPFITDPIIGQLVNRFWAPGPWSRKLVDQGYVSTIELYWSPARVTWPGPYPHSGPTYSHLGHTYESVGYGLTAAVGAVDGLYSFKNSNSTTEQNNLDAYAANPIYPLNVSHAQTPPHGKMLMLVETYTTGVIGGLNGNYRAGAARKSGTTGNRLFNYNGGVVRSYVDGHANSITASPPSVSGITSHITSGVAAPVHENELGWNVHANSSGGEILTGHYSGHWSYLHTRDDFNLHEPWYQDWRNGWNKGYR